MCAILPPQAVAEDHSAPLQAAEYKEILMSKDIVTARDYELTYLVPTGYTDTELGQINFKSILPDRLLYMII